QKHPRQTIPAFVITALILLLIIILFSLIYINSVNSQEICTGANICSGSYDLNCKVDPDGFCPEDYGDWSECQLMDTGGRCYPCDPDCKYKNGVRDPNGESICTPFNLIVDTPVNPRENINILVSIVNPILPNKITVYKGSLIDKNNILGEKSFDAIDIQNTQVLASKNIYLKLNEIKQFTAYGALQYVWSIESG
ncbi:MAG: hypothetical protein AAB907_04415, partial [Patescibacteria group bacterium]